MNWIRANVPPTTRANVSTASVLATPGTPSSRQVALGQQADEHPLDQPVLPDDHPLDLEHDAFEQLAVVRRCGRGFAHPTSSLKLVGRIRGTAVVIVGRIRGTAVVNDELASSLTVPASPAHGVTAVKASRTPWEVTPGRYRTDPIPAAPPASWRDEAHPAAPGTATRKRVAGHRRCGGRPADGRLRDVGPDVHGPACPSGSHP